MSNYKEEYKNLYKEMIKKCCLILVDKLEDEFRGTGKTFALKELQSEGYFVLGDKSCGFDDLDSLSKKVNTVLKNVDIKSIKVLVDEGFGLERGSAICINEDNIRVEVLGGFIHNSDLKFINNIKCVLCKDSKIVEIKMY